MSSELEQTRALLNRALGVLEVFAPESKGAEKMAGEIRDFLSGRWQMEALQRKQMEDQLNCMRPADFGGLGAGREK